MNVHITTTNKYLALNIMDYKAMKYLQTYTKSFINIISLRRKNFDITQKLNDNEDFKNDYDSNPCRNN